MRVCRALGLCGWSETPPPSLVDSGSEVSPSEGPRGPAPHVPGDTRRAAQGRRYEARRRHSRCRCYLELPPAQAPSEVRGLRGSRAARRRADCGGLRRRKTVAPPPPAGAAACAPPGQEPGTWTGFTVAALSGRVPARAAGAQMPSERWPRAADAGEAQGEGGGARCRGRPAVWLSSARELGPGRRKAGARNGRWCGHSVLRGRSGLPVATGAAGSRSAWDA